MPTAIERTTDSVDSVAAGPSEQRTALLTLWHTMNTELGRDGHPHSFAFAVVAKAR